MISQENINTILKLYDFYNKNSLDNLSVFDDYFSSHVKFHDPAISTKKAGLDVIKHAELDYIQAFPDKSIHLDSLFPVDDKVVVRWTCTGTQKGQFHDIPASHNPIHVSGISIYTLVNGKIVEVWQMWDRFGLVNQLQPAAPVAERKAA